MFGNAFGWPHLLLILAVVLLLFGAAKLPALAKSVGQSMKVFRKEIKTDDDADADRRRRPRTSRPTSPEVVAARSGRSRIPRGACRSASTSSNSARG